MSPHGHLIVPLKAMDKVVGVLCLYLPVGVGIEEDRKMLLYILGAQIGIAIDNARLYEETKRLSIRDPLTGLANRRLMDIMLEKSFARAKRLGSPFSCIMLDIDYFKKYNDTYGHPAGDSLLIKIAGILLDEVREIDLVVRYGGEEFFVLLPDVKSPEALRAAERIRLAVEAGTGVTVSLGISSYNQGVRTREDIIKNADYALYQAKQLGRNRIELNAA
jgi:diguanylate cyclase (GGDEF)-like protein